MGPSPPFSLSKAAREFTEFTEDLSVSFSSVHKSRGPNGTSPATPPAINKINAPPLRSGFIPLKEKYQHSTRPKVVHTDQDGYFIKRENIGPNGEIQDPITSQNWDSISNVAQGQLKYYTNQCRGVTHENLSSAEWIRVGVKIEIELQDTPDKDLPRPGDGERFKKSKDQKNKKHPGNSPVIDTYGPETKIQEENYPLLSEQEMSVKEKISGWEDATIQSVTCKGSERWGKQRVKRETSSEQRVMPPPVQPTIPSPLSPGAATPGAGTASIRAPGTTARFRSQCHHPSIQSFKPGPGATHPLVTPPQSTPERPGTKYKPIYRK